MAKSGNYDDDKIVKEFTKAGKAKRKLENKRKHTTDARKKAKYSEQIKQQDDKLTILKQIASRTAYRSSTTNTNFNTEINVAKNHVSVNKPKKK